MQQVLLLKGLGCASCAAEIERQVNNLPEVENATVDIMTGRMNLTVEESQTSMLDKLFLQIEKIVHKSEPDVVIERMQKGVNDTYSHEVSCEGGCDIASDNGKKESPVPTSTIVRLAISGALLLLTIFVEFAQPWRFIISFASYIIIGGDILYKAFRNILRGQVFDENFLMSIATVGAFILGEYAEGIAVMFLYQLGEMFQGIAVHRSRKSITDLMDIRPDYANLVSGEEILEVSPEAVKVGDHIVVKPGERIPLDGVVIEGSSTVDTSAISGESVPRDVVVQDKVISGSINLSGLMTVKVEKEYGQSTVAKVLDLVENATANKAESEKFITRFSRYYTPVVVIVAALLATLPPLITGQPFATWAYRAMVFLVISCPCALVISVPLAFFGALGGASKAGIMIKGSNYIEALAKTDVVVFDKTGTLTKGVFTVTDIEPVGISKEQLLYYAAHAESFSNHPISLSIQKAYGKEVDHNKVEDYQETAGHGVSARIEGKQISAGNDRLMESLGIVAATIDKPGTVVHVAQDDVYLGYILIADEIKKDAKAAIQGKKNNGVKKAIMLTGDNEQVAAHVAKQLDLDGYYAELLPQHKVEIAEKLMQEHTGSGTLAFVGDGINDAPVLATADLGIAMGALGSDAAIEAADVVIMTDEPSKIVVAKKQAKRSLRIVKQNIVFALGVKLVVLVMGAFGFAGMWQAVFADVGVSLLAILNSVRALRVSGLDAK